MKTKHIGKINERERRIKNHTYIDRCTVKSPLCLYKIKYLLRLILIWFSWFVHRCDFYSFDQFISGIEMIILFDKIETFQFRNRTRMHARTLPQESPNQMILIFFHLICLILKWPNRNICYYVCIVYNILKSDGLNVW